MSGRRMLYLIGQPGSGKSTLLERLLDDLAYEPRLHPIGHLAYERGVQLGGRRLAFCGTDTLPMNVQPLAVAWLSSPAAPETVIAEGDRLANDSFFVAMTNAGWELSVVLLDTPDALAAERRSERAIRLDTPLQNATWLKGRITKTRKLAERWVGPRARLDGNLPPGWLADELSRHPVVRTLRGDAGWPKL